jgi:UDP-2-acetamido-3-amino-2,3-dideoxy-glucuronate N-acetyltransferase
MSRFGERLRLPLRSDQPAVARCAHTGDQYRLENGKVSLFGEAQ